MGSTDNKNAIIAVLLSGIILFGWQYFFGVKPSQTTSNLQNKEVVVAKDTKDVSTSLKDDQTTSEITSMPKDVQIVLTNNIVEVVLNNHLQVIDIKSLDSDIDLKNIYTKFDNTLSLKIGDKISVPNFTFNKVDDVTYSVVDNDLAISGLVKLDQTGTLKVSLNSNTQFVPTFSLISKAKKMEDETKTNNFVLYNDGLESVVIYDKIQGESDEVEGFEGKTEWFGLDFDYHLFAFAFDKKGIFKSETRNNILRVAPIEPAANLEYNVVFIKKNYDQLKSRGYNLHKSVDFGIWALIAVPLLRGLQYFYSWANNYGVSIIILTILVRLFTFPLQYKSFKSMKKMQVIQPELKKIKEKYKDNPQKQQQETMALFKKTGANPLSGCLPMILQMPVFFAFYKVLFTSVELVDAPFYFWITDLSAKDPFYILPILMGGAMFLNMKFTPSTTTDPAQQKVMMFMPVIFSLFMINLPSGLTLYILVSTIVGMLQQLFVFKRT